MRIILCGVLCCSPLLASYQLSSLLPGEAVDPITDLTEFSFSVPHALKKFGFSANPEYAYSSHDHSLAPLGHSAGGSLFGYTQLDRLRLGVVTRNTTRSHASFQTEWRNNSKLMVSYLLPFMSFGVEGGGFHGSNDSPADRWGATGAVSLSFYGIAWGIDASARVLRPNGSYATPGALPSVLSRTSYLPLLPGSELYSLRWRVDWSYTWRMVLSGKILTSPAADYLALSTLWRYRSGFLQLLTGANYAQTQIYDRSRNPYALGAIQINWPIYLILEHGRSVFYVGGSAPVFNGFVSDTGSSISSVIRFEPALAYTYRFNRNWWGGFNLSSQSFNFYSSEYDTEPRRELRISLQVAYNLAPFGADDEVPLSDKFLTAMR